MEVHYPYIVVHTRLAAVSVARHDKDAAAVRSRNCKRGVTRREFDFFGQPQPVLSVIGKPDLPGISILIRPLFRVPPADEKDPVIMDNADAPVPRSSANTITFQHPLDTITR